MDIRSRSATAGRAYTRLKRHKPAKKFQEHEFIFENTGLSSIWRKPIGRRPMLCEVGSALRARRSGLVSLFALFPPVQSLSPSVFICVHPRLKLPHLGSKLRLAVPVFFISWFRY